jgi:hypothetical protein
VFEPTGTLADIVPEARQKFVALLAKADELGMHPVIRSAGRTCADQQAIYEKGEGATHAALCRSWHVLGRAIDINIVPPSCEAYTELGEFWEDMGGIWGGRFPGFGACGDMAHFEYAPSAAVPLSVCPDDISLQECEDIRQGYLASAVGQGGARILAALAGMAFGGGLGFFLTRWR